MNVQTSPGAENAGAIPAAHSRVGLIIPSVNRMTEPQFNRYAPRGLGFNVARARIAGKWRRPLAEMADEMGTAAKLLSDVAPDLIVFHCTNTAMSQGVNGEPALIDIVKKETGIEAETTSRMVLEALRALGLRKLLVLSPYKSNRIANDYLEEAGFAVIHDVALDLDNDASVEFTPGQWTELARAHDRDDIDGVFLSCTNTTQIEAIESIERSLGKPVVNSNQAVLWSCLKRLRPKLPTIAPMPSLGRLFARLEP